MCAFPDLKSLHVCQEKVEEKLVACGASCMGSPREAEAQRTCRIPPRARVADRRHLADVHEEVVSCEVHSSLRAQGAEAYTPTQKDPLTVSHEPPRLERPGRKCVILGKGDGALTSSARRSCRPFQAQGLTGGLAPTWLSMKSASEGTPPRGISICAVDMNKVPRPSIEAERSILPR